MAWTRTLSYSASSVAVFAVCFMVATVVLGYHVYMIWMKGKKNRGEQQDGGAPQQRSKEWRRQYAITSTKWATMICVLSFWICIMISLIYRMRDLRIIPFRGFCSDYIPLLVTLWSLGKSAMFFVFITRIYTSFLGSMHQYSDVLIACLYSSWAVSFGGVLAVSVLLTDGSDQRMIGGGGKNRICVARINRYAALYVALNDLIWNLVMAYLFVKPILRLSKPIHRQNDQNHHNGHASELRSVPELELSFLPIKYFMITAVAVISTLLSTLLTGFTGLGVLMIIDCCINLLCIVFMTRDWTRMYWFVCSPILHAWVTHSRYLDRNPEYRNDLLRWIDYHRELNGCPITM